MTLSSFIEPLPSAVGKKLKMSKPSDEQVLIQIRTEVAEDLSFAERWLVVTEQRVLLLSPDGADAIVDLPLEEITAARLQGLVGGGRLILERNGGAPTFLYFCRSLAPKFAAVARRIWQLYKGESLALPMVVEGSRCAKCMRLLPEKNGICLACVNKWGALGRIALFVKPYRGTAVLLGTVMVVGTLAELLPPLVIQHIID